MKILIVDDIKGWRDYHAQHVLNLFSDAELYFAESAREAYDIVLEHNAKPFDIVLTDMQMETDFEPKYAGEWFVEQIKSLKSYGKTKIFIISAAYNIDFIAKTLDVDYIRKTTARNFPEVYAEIKS